MAAIWPLPPPTPVLPLTRSLSVLPSRAGDPMNVPWPTMLLSLRDLLGVAIIYAASQGVIWLLSIALAPIGLESFGPVLAMTILFCAWTAAATLSPGCDRVYAVIRPKVDIINAHLGVGFLTPIVMLSRHNKLSGVDIARVFGAFCLTTLVSPITIFGLVMTTLAGTKAFSAHLQRPQEALFAMATPTDPESTDASSARATRTSTDSEAPPNPNVLTSPLQGTVSRTTDVISANWPILLPLCGVAVSIVAAIISQDDHMDGFTLTFLWITLRTLQRSFRGSSILRSRKQAKSSMTVLLNPIVSTAALFIAYLKCKSLAEGRSMEHVLSRFSTGTPLYAIWTSKFTGTTLPDNPEAWFGAGDAALSMLNVGMVTWGFKLYECRHQLFSLAGMITSVLCVIMAAASVFLSVLAARGLGLHGPEALAFAARSTTLALAKPATEAVGGSLVVNASLIVSNGIVGQLLYPFVLDRLGVEKSGRQARDDDASPEPQLASRWPSHKMERSPRQTTRKHVDKIVTVAAGVTVGVHGAAMGVSYLYETESHAAPYAALSMTVFGVATFICMKVEPFRTLVEWLAVGHLVEWLAVGHLVGG